VAASDFDHQDVIFPGRWHPFSLWSERKVE